MKEIHIGEIIRQRRKELKLSQEELSFGICKPATLSRIEKGHQTPGRSILDALLQRLGLPSKKFYALLSENELKIEELKTKIVAENVRRNCDRISDLLDELAELVEDDNHITQQFILRIRAYNGRKENGILIPYTLEEQLEMFFSAIHLTIPRFDTCKINMFLYSLDEVKIINHIALTYCFYKIDAIGIFPMASPFSEVLYPIKQNIKQ